MALKPIIYKIKISLSDLDRNVYETLNLTLAQHPSETQERMMVRVLAYSINYEEDLRFTNGLSAVKEPDLWAHSLDGQTTLWIDVGEPTFDRIKKATRLSPCVKVYGFNTKSDQWWTQNQDKLGFLSASIYKFQWDELQVLTKLIARKMDLSITLTGNTAYVSSPSGECELSWNNLKA